MRRVPAEPPRWVAVGRITRAHGVRGEVAVLPLSQVTSRLEPGSVLVLEQDPARTLTVVAARPHRGRVLVRFDGLQDRDAAAVLRGAYLFVEGTASPQLPHGEFWAHRIVGCDVGTESGRVLGTVREIVHAPANDLWVAVTPEGRETFLPALANVVLDVDVDRRLITVRDVPGLTWPESDA